MLRSAGALLRATGPARTQGRPARPRLLLVRPDHIGDVLLTTPAVELLRKGLPDAHLTMMVGPWSEEVTRRDSLLDAVTIFPFPGFTRAPKTSALAPYRQLWDAARVVRHQRFDAALVLRFDHWWGAWMAALARVPLRIGYSVGECAPFLTHRLPVVPRVHWAERALAVSTALLDLWGPGEASPGASGDARSYSAHKGRGLGEPPLRFPLREEDERSADALLRDGFSFSRRLVVFHPGSGAQLKLWPEEHWVHLGWTLVSKGARVLLTGSTSERPLAERIAAAVPGARSVVGQTDLGTLAALFRRSALVTGVDSGPLHLAVASGVPTVHLFGPTDPAVYGPWGDGARHRVVASGWPGAPCGRLDLEPAGGVPPPCMSEIDPDRVAAVCLELMSDDE